MKESHVLVIIVNYNKKEYVASLLKSLQASDYKGYDVVVVDNASTDGTVEHLIEIFPYVEVIRNSKNTGGSGGFNTGLNYAFKKEGYEYYWLLDNDVVVSSDALGKLVAILDNNRDIAVAGSHMCQLDNPEVTNEIGAYVNFHDGRLVLNRHLTRRRNNSTGIFDVDYVAAASLLVRSEVAKKAGLFDDFFIHYDDIDWCLRIKEMGHRVVSVADSVIWHLSSAEKPITWVMYFDVRNMLFLLDKHASKKDAARVGRRNVLQAIHTELKGLTHVAEIILDAVEDFQKGVKGGKVFNFPPDASEETIKNTHPDKDVLMVQNEWFDLRKFPFEESCMASIREIILPPYLIDAAYYWSRRGGIPVKHYSKYKKVLIALFAIISGYRKYKRAYVDIRYIPYIASLFSDELIVNIGEAKWVIKRDRITVWRNLFHVVKRGLKLYAKLLF